MTEGPQSDPVPADEPLAPDEPAAVEVPVTEREVERKLRVPALFTIPPLVGDHTGIARMVARPPLVLTATYFDTDDLRLARWGVTLRRREGGSDEGWHLKLPVAGAHPGDRDEVRLPLEAGSIGEPPRVLTDIVLAFIRGSAVRPVATLRTERTPVLLRSSDERVIAELVDDVVSVLDGDRVAGRFREIEVEARDGSSGDLDRVVDALTAAGAELGTTGKAAHALGPRATAPPDVPPPNAPRPRDPASTAVHAHLLTQTRRLLLNDVRMRRDLPDSVHQMRVAARRLRSSLRTFRPLVDAEWADSLREDLGWLAGELGAVRDTEVLLERLDRHCDLIADPAARDDARAVVDTALGEQLAQARARALEALSSERYLHVLERLVADVRVPPFTELAAEPSRSVLPALSWKAWKHLRREVAGLRDDTASEHWHRARIIAKRARYAAEAIEPVFGHDAAGLAESLEAVTEILGDHQDSSIAQDTIAQLAQRPGLSARQGWALGLLYAVESDAERRTRSQFRQVWKSAARAHRRSALH